MQLWAIGRANPGNIDVPRVVSASDIPMDDGATPEPLTLDDIKRTRVDCTDVHLLTTIPCRLHQQLWQSCQQCD